MFTRGIVPGKTVNQRLANIRRPGLRSGPYAQEFQAFLAEAAERVRKVFHGPLTYASTMFEVVDWSLFDYIGIDHYRNSKVERRYAERIGPYLGQGKPVINTEFGHSSYLRHDLDMTATSLVKTYACGHGTTYPDLPWEPKQAFGAVASFYATH